MQSVAELVELLSIFEPIGSPVISLYLNAQADDHGHDSYHTFVRNELRERAKTFQPGSPERESFDKDAERITTYLDDEIKPSANGIAIFACSGAGDFFEAIQLDAPIENNRLFVYDQPHLYPLARLMDQYPRYAVLVSNTNSARIFVFGRGAKLDSEVIKNKKTNRTKVGGWSQMRYQRHLANYHLHHAKEVIDVLERVVQEDKAEYIILAGDDVIIPLLREQMPQQLAEKVIDVLSLDINAPEHEIFETSLEALREHDSQTDAEKVGNLMNEYRGNGLAMVGVANALTALSNGQADDLLISATAGAINYDEEKVKAVLAAYSTSEGEAGIDTNEPRMVADELVKRAQASAATVTFIEDANLLAEVGGVGVTLRYRI